MPTIDKPEPRRKIEVNEATPPLQPEHLLHPLELEQNPSDKEVNMDNKIETENEIKVDGRIDKRLIIILAAVLILCGAAAITKFYLIPNKIIFNGLPSLIKSNTETGGLLPASKGSDFSLNSGAYNADDVTFISNFEANEAVKWLGDGIVDEKIFYEGARSLSLVSTERNGAVATLEKKLDLTNMKQVEFMLHVTDIDAFETVTLDFGDLGLTNYYRYTFTNLKNGWNLIQIPKGKFVLSKAPAGTFDWPNVEKIRFSILSRPASIFLVRMDMLRSINYPESFLTQWKATQPAMFFSLYEQAGKAKLLARSLGSTMATLKDSAGISNFDFSASVSPQSAGRSGLFVRGDYATGYGYYLLLGGANKNTWQILKRSKAGWTPATEIIKGSLDGTVFAKDKDYWLRVTGKGSLLKFYYSSDGQRYEKLGELTDDEFKGGGLGIAVPDAGFSLFDNIQFKKN
jgi:hypothetical protein